MVVVVVLLLVLSVVVEVVFVPVVVKVELYCLVQERGRVVVAVLVDGSGVLSPQQLHFDPEMGSWVMY